MRNIGNKPACAFGTKQFFGLVEALTDVSGLPFEALEVALRISECNRRSAC